MNILLIGDLHLEDRASEIPDKFMGQIQKADLVLCTGDITSEETFEKIRDNSTDLRVVQGDHDRISLPSQDIVEVGNLKIGLIHGDQYDDEEEKLEKLVELADQLNVRTIVSGDTHQPYRTIKDNVLLLNPGTATGVPSEEGKGGEKSCIRLELEDGDLHKIEILSD